MSHRLHSHRRHDAGRLSLLLAVTVAGLAAASCGPSHCPSCPPAAAASSSPPLPSSGAPSDEGMWTLDRFPSALVGAKHGFAPDARWLEHVRLASVRLAGGCSGSFVSPSGLVMTNHHCAHHCVQQLSTKDRDYVKEGYFAAELKDEVKCPDIEVNQLTAITDVTEQVQAAARGLDDRAGNEARKAEMSRLEKACATSDELRCDVVSLYHGGLYHLYQYRRYQDVRLVFAPELAIAFFGGDPDNFNFPRYDLDVSFLRVYAQGTPARTDDYFRWSASGARAGELTFVSGHPGRTSRQLTVSQLEVERDVLLPWRLLRLAELRGLLTEFQKRGDEQKRISGSLLFGVENSLKALRGMHQALLDPALMRAKLAAEQSLRASIDADPAKRARYGGAWDAIDKAQARKRELRLRYVMIEQLAGLWGDLPDIARALVRSADELPKPNEARLREFVDSQKPALEQQLFSTAPIYPELEILTLGFSLTQLREQLGADDPLVKRVLGPKAPVALATELVQGTTVADVATRRALYDGGRKAVDASTDPLVRLLAAIDAEARAVRKQFEDEVEAVEKRGAELVAQARFEVLGTSVYPDATFTLRLSFGQVRGWLERGQPVPPFTTIGGAFDRHTGADPYDLPKSWLDARARLDLALPMNFCTSNDIIGGNSGSPVINRDAEVVGLIFDGNIHSLGGDYAFDESVNRAVAVHSAAIVEALGKIYGAERLRDELLPKDAARSP